MTDTYTKDPDATLDYGIDWTAWLGDDVIVTSTWLVPDDITLATGPKAPTHTDTATTCWITGGTAGKRYRIVNRIATAAGRVDDRTIVINCRDR